MSQPRTNGIHAENSTVTLHCPFVGLPTASELSVNSVGGVRRKTSEKHPRCFNKGPPLPGGGDVTVIGWEGREREERERERFIEIFWKKRDDSFLFPKMEVWKMIFLVIFRFHVSFFCWRSYCKGKKECISLGHKKENLCWECLDVLCSKNIDNNIVFFSWLMVTCHGRK